MGSFTYPVAHPEGQLTTEQLHMILRNPRVISTRVAELAKMRFIADFLLTGRFDAQGGGIFYETGEELFPADVTQAVAPGGEYPFTILTVGNMAAAKVTKWGLGTRLTDEKLAREGRSYLDRALARIVNGMIRDVDGVAMAVIQSKVTSEFTSPAAWTTAGKAAEALLTIQSERSDLATGIELETVVMKASQWAKLVGMLVDDKALPREQHGVVMAGRLPVDAYGLTWATSPQYKLDTPMFVDRRQLGGMGDERLNSPGWARAGNVGVETISERASANDAWDVRTRRPTVPVVLEPMAGVLLKNTGL